MKSNNELVLNMFLSLTPRFHTQQEPTQRVGTSRLELLNRHSLLLDWEQDSPNLTQRHRAVLLNKK